MFKRPFSFEGRIRRLEYGLTIIIYFFACFVASLIADAGKQSSAGAMALILIIPLVWFHLAQGAKRCHDLGNSGWYQLIPFYGLFMLFQEGYAGDTQYGPDPKAPNPETDTQID